MFLISSGSRVGADKIPMQDEYEYAHKGDIDLDKIC